MPKITNKDRNSNSVIHVKTKTTAEHMNSQGYKWWSTKDDTQLANELIATAGFLKEQQQYRYRQAGIYARLYGNMPLFNFAGANLNKMQLNNNLPIDRPTMNVVQSCIDTLVSRVTQSRPRPIFLTDNGDYKERNLAKQLNNFIVGELYNSRAYELGELLLRDACALGTGCIKVFENMEKRVMLERVMLTELLVDQNEARLSDPRQMYQFSLVDRKLLMEQFPEYKKEIAAAETAYPDQSADSQRSVADQVMVVEGWRLPSSKNSGDGMHAIACSAGIIFKEEWKKSKFPFVFMHYSPRIMGFWGQGLAEQLMGTQVEINKLLITMSQAINLVGVPRVFVEDGSKIVKAHLNNNVGSIVTYRGTPPQYVVAPCVPGEMYDHLQRLIQYAYQQSGVSALAATAQKPAGLNSGEAIRNYDDLQSDRFAALVRRYDNVFVDLAYQITDLAKEIAERDGKYTTVYPNKNAAKQVDLPKTSILDDTYVIQCFDASSLPRDPAGRLQKVTEMAQAGMISMQEARRLLDYPDLEQVDKLANSSEERILQILDEIVEDGKYTPPDPFMDLQLAMQLTTQYYNLYASAKLEESKAQKLIDFSTQIQTLIQASMPPPMPGAPGAAPQGVPQAPPVSDILPNAPQ